MKNIIILIFVFFFYTTYSQNLLQNGNFEQYISCPGGQHSIDSCAFWHSPTTDSAGVSGTPDYFNQCAFDYNFSVPENIVGFQYARSGQAYTGIYLRYFYFFEYKEYIESPLTQPLVAGSCYHFEMYVNLANNCQLTTDNIQIYFSDTAVNGINNYLHLPFTPQVANVQGNNFDTLSWTLVSGNYTAHGGETNIIIGNFIPDSLTDTLYVNSAGLDPWGIYVYIDDVSLSLCTGVNENEDSKKEIEVFPNPMHDILNIRTAVNFKAAEFTVFDATGRKVMHKNIGSQATFSTKELKQSIYFYKIKDAKGKEERGKIVKE
jgi:OOP family OmpA-OmpF porin